MGIICPQRQTRASRMPLATTMTVGAAVFIALYTRPNSAKADAISESPPSPLQVVTVTATRRELTPEEVPYNISVVSADSLARTGVTDIASLAYQVPSLSLYDMGARWTAATSPVIRGVNATSLEVADRAFRNFEQSPVGTYFGDSPIDGYFQLDDINRVEVLRGPQGTLYGAGALGGALRIMPNEPVLGQLSGNVQAGAGALAHSDGIPYDASAMLNVPLGDTLAFRVAGKYVYEPGFIDVYGLEQRTGSILYGSPVLTDPADPVNSSTSYSGKKDWNYQRTFTGRASLLWKPVESFSAETAFVYSTLTGDGGPYTNPLAQAGPYFIDPRISFPAGGDYKAFSSTDQPFWRRTTLGNLELSYDAGFATLSSTSSYYTTRGLTVGEVTYGFAGFGILSDYYGGVPLNPHFLTTAGFSDAEHAFTEELRLVSTTGPNKIFDYVVGAFYERQVRRGDWNIVSPGSYERSVAQGCIAPFLGVFPNCLLTVGPNDTDFAQLDTQRFEEKSVYGELTWHFLKKAQITFGGRHFTQHFTDAQPYLDYTFSYFLPGTPQSTSMSKNVWKINPSYEYAQGQHVYAIWSQGFRRGGANSVPLVGGFKESPVLETYAPDSVNNYEVGFKGRFANAMTYTIDVFDIEWNKPQISATTPIGNLAVYNANKARSRGVEIESSGPLLMSGLTYTIGATYTDAKLTADYSLPANDGTGNVVPGAISGKAGEQMPGSPKVSAAASIIYDRAIAPEYELNVTLNGTYKGRVPIALVRNLTVVGGAPNASQAYGLLNFSTSLSHHQWFVAAYVTNLLDKRVLFTPLTNSPIYTAQVNAFTAETIINKPRQVGFRLGYSF